MARNYNKKTNNQLKQALNRFNKSEVGKSNVKDEGRIDDVWNAEGVLRQIELNYIKEDGWIVDSEGGPYRCTFTSIAMEIPEGIIRNGYLIPTKEIKVKMSVDRVSGEYNILSLVNENPLNILETGTITLEKDDSYLIMGGTSAQIAHSENSISINEDEIDISSSSIKFNGETIENNAESAINKFLEENDLEE